MRRAIQRVTAAAIAVLTSVVLFYALRDPLIGAVPKAVLLLMSAGAAVAPGATLLVLVAALPLAFLGSAVSGTPFHDSEAIVIASICGGAWRAAFSGRDDAVAADLWPSLAVTAAVVACSLAVVLADVWVLDPSLFTRSIVRTVTEDYLRQRDVLAGADQGLFALESLLLFAAAARAARSRPQWTAAFARMLVAGAVGAAALNVIRLLQIGLRSTAPLATMRSALQTVRINTGYGDVNAAGSYFALAGVMACGLAAADADAFRVAGIAACAMLAAAAWLTGSRAAVAAAILGIAAVFGGRLRTPGSRRLALYGLAACGLAGLVFLAFFPNPLTGPEARFSVTMRLEMARIALRMFASHPIFGIGISTFYSTSGPYLAASPLREFYTHENAHNNVLQLATELGLAGVLAVAWLTAVIVARCRAANHAAQNERRLLRVLIAANLAFVATMLLGHPLLTPEVSFVFALSMGAMTGVGTGGIALRTPNIVAVVAVAILAGTLPYRIHDRIAHANMEHVGWGVGDWKTDSTGEKMRPLTAPRATLFVPPQVRWIELPYRLAAQGPPVRLAVVFRGHRADDLVVSGTTAARYRLVIADPRPTSEGFERLDLTVISGDASNVLVGKVIPN